MRISYILPVSHDHLQVNLSPALLSRLILESYISEHSIAGYCVYNYRSILYSCPLHHTVCCFGLVIIIKRYVLCCVLTAAGTPSTVIVSQWMKEPQLIPNKRLQEQVSLVIIYHDRGAIICGCVCVRIQNIICIIGDN